MSRSVGALALVRLGKTRDEIAKCVGVSKTTAHHWCTGEKKPGKMYRAKLLELFSIAIEAWDALPEPKKAKLPTSTPPPPRLPSADAGSANAMAHQLESFARAQLLDLLKPGEDGAVASPLERAKVGASIAGMLEKLSKLTGEHDLGRKGMKLPLFQRIRTELGLALKPWPDAARAVAERFESLDREAAQ